MATCAIKHVAGTKKVLLKSFIFGPRDEGNEMYPSYRVVNTVHEGGKDFSCAYSRQSLVQVYKYCIGLTLLLLLHRSLVAKWDKMAGGWGWAGLLGGGVGMMEGGGGGGGGVAMVMKVEYARLSSLLHSGGGDLTDGWEDGRRGEGSTTCCYWTWRTEPASAGGAL